MYDALFGTQTRLAPDWLCPPSTCQAQFVSFPVSVHSRVVGKFSQDQDGGLPSLVPADLFNPLQTAKKKSAASDFGRD